MICQICITSNKADHLITFRGDSLVVCDTCFENRPDDAIEANPQPSECHDCADCSGLKQPGVERLQDCVYFVDCNGVDY